MRAIGSVNGAAEMGHVANGRRQKVRIRRFSRSLPMLLLQAREAVMRHFRASLRSFEVTEQQWRVLRALNDNGETEVSDLADRTHLLKPSLSRILKDLDARSLTKRRTDATDQRRGLISITAAGSRLIADVAPASERIYDEIALRFGGDRLELLQDLLKQLAEVMAEAMDPHIDFRRGDG